MDRSELIPLSKTALNRALELMGKEEGWSRACDIRCGGAVLEWRNGETFGLERDDGEPTGSGWRAWRVGS